jgi:hypothetical protein
MKAPLVAFLFLLCSAQTPQTDSLIHFADGSTLRCAKYETGADLIVIYTTEGNQFTIRKSSVAKIEAVRPEVKKEENKMRVIETGVPRKTGPSLAEASALYGNAKGGGFTVLEDNGSPASEPVPEARDDTQERTMQMKPTNRQSKGAGKPAIPREESAEDRLWRVVAMDKAGTRRSPSEMEQVKRNFCLESCRVERDQAPASLRDPKDPVHGDAASVSDKSHKNRVVGMIRNRNRECLSNVAITIASDSGRIRPITLRYLSLNPGVSPYFSQETDAGEYLAETFHIDRISFLFCNERETGPRPK